MLSATELEEMSADIYSLYESIEDDLLKNVIKRFETLEDITPGSIADWQTKMLEQMGALSNENIRIISRYSGKTLKELQRILTDAGYGALNFDEGIFEEAHSRGLLENKPLPARASYPLKQILQGALDNTRSSFNLINTTALQSAQDGFLNIVNQVYLETSTGITDYNTAVRKAVRQLADKGITGADYISTTGRRTRNHIDVAVKRAIHTSTGQTSGVMQVQRAKEWGSNLVEVTSHMGARPEHARWQGKIYSLEGGTREYPNLVRATDYGSVTGLKGANCKHDFYPYFEGISRQRYKPYSEKENADAYVKSQAQRTLERAVREQKRRVLAAEAMGDKTAKTAYQLKLKEKEAALKQFVSTTGRTQRTNRQQIVGFGHSEAAQAVWTKRRNAGK